MSAVGRIGGIGRLGLVAAAVRALFDPRSLFAAGEQGVWHDPSDLSTLFQDSAGTTPVTAVEQPVGLMLDKRLGLVQGSELVANGDFSNGTTGWMQVLGSIAVVAGLLRVSRPSVDVLGRASTPISCIPGRLYRVQLDRYKGTSTTSGLAIAITATSVSGAIYTSSVTVDGRFTFYFFATQSTHWLFLESGPGAAGIYSEFDNISVRELPGNHAFQSTATARPAYRESPQRMNFDAVDDVHTTTFPASLGSNCTIARAIPGVGASILTSQTVGTTFNNTITHAGMLIVDRALNTGEAAMLTAYLNAKAGV